MAKNNIMNINFDDGFKEFTLNGDKDRVIRWNPNDINIVDRYFELIDWLENDLDTLMNEAKIKDGLTEDNIKASDYNKGSMRKLGDLIDIKVNELFNSDVMYAAFRGTNPLSPSTNGPLFGNFIAAIAPILEDSFKEAELNSNKYIEQAINHQKSMKGK